jgi:hypothetical protein
MGRFPGRKTPPAPRLDRRSRHRELPDPELRPDQLELVLPGDLTRIGCHRVYLTSRGEIDQSIGHNRGVLQPVSGAETELSIACSGMQCVQDALRRADKERAGRECRWGEGLCLWNSQRVWPVPRSSARTRQSCKPRYSLSPAIAGDVWTGPVVCISQRRCPVRASRARSVKWPPI